MAARGLYRTKTEASGTEYAFVDYGIASIAGEIPRSQYERKGYKPDFGELQTKEQYKASKADKKSDD
jgi:hypothetical protein